MITAPLKFPALATASLLALAGCLPKSSCDLPLPANKTAAAGIMGDCLNSMSATPVAQMPTSGSATYNGYVTGKFAPSAGASDTLIGDAVLNASFGGGTNAVTGTLSNISTGADPTIGGTLAVTSSAILGNVATFQINGTLTGYGSDTLSFATNGAGGFLGDHADGLAFATNGTASMGSGYVDNGAGLAVVARK